MPKKLCRELGIQAFDLVWGFDLQIDDVITALVGNNHIDGV